MRISSDHGGSGTYATDVYRENVGKAAANILEQGRSVQCVVGDHTGSETCAEVIVRLASSATKAGFFIDGGKGNTGRDTILKAVKALREGVGVNAVAGTHSGGNTCAAVIAGIKQGLAGEKED